ncbi:MAG: hypothetical protein ACI4RF_00440 [Eubacterium sp.]
MVFYSYLNEKDNAYLYVNDLIRDDIMNSWKNIAEKCDLKDLSDIFHYN